MADKEFKRLSRPQLIEIIYQFQLKEEELTAQIQDLNAQLESRRIRMESVGSIAEAALEINNVMGCAQAAADQYLQEIRQLQAETEAACQKMLEDARKEAEEIRSDAKDTQQVIGYDGQ